MGTEAALIQTSKCRQFYSQITVQDETSSLSVPVDTGWNHVKICFSDDTLPNEVSARRGNQVA